MLPHGVDHHPAACCRAKLVIERYIDSGKVSVVVGTELKKKMIF
jgi:hypothetical protein